MAEKRDEESGKFVEQYDEDDFLDAIRSHDTPTTQRVADEVGCSYDLAYRRLHALKDEGGVGSTEVGGSLVWRLI